MEGRLVAQLVKRPTLDFGSGHDLRIMRLSPALSSVFSRMSARDSLSPSAPPLHAHMQSLSLSNKQIFFKKIGKKCP